MEETDKRVLNGAARVLLNQERRITSGSFTTIQRRKFFVAMPHPASFFPDEWFNENHLAEVLDTDSPTANLKIAKIALVGRSLKFTNQGNGKVNINIVYGGRILYKEGPGEIPLIVRAKGEISSDVEMKVRIVGDRKQDRSLNDKIVLEAFDKAFSE